MAYAWDYEPKELPPFKNYNMTLTEIELAKTSHKQWTSGPQTGLTQISVEEKEWFFPVD